jgi:ABC-type transporter Mla subunit MlaD
MKCETTHTILTLLLALLVLAGVLFALQSIFRTREFRTLQSQVIARQTNLNRLNALLNEAIVYGKTHPDINRIIQPFEAKPVVR